MTIHAYRWLPDEGSNFRALVQISHGMGEHAARYSGFAEHMVDSVIEVYANDHRGHGRTAIDLEHAGSLGPDGWDAVVRDMRQLSIIAKEENDLPLFGFIAPNSFYLKMFLGMDRIWEHTSEVKIPNDLPILLISGSKDPVGHRTKGVQSFAHRYKEHGIEDLTTSFHEDGRHEILNDIDREHVYSEIIEWIEPHLYEVAR